MANRDPCTDFWDEEAFCLRVHVVTQPCAMEESASQWSTTVAAFAIDKDESNSIRLSYNRTMGHIPKESVQVKPSAPQPEREDVCSQSLADMLRQRKCQEMSSVCSSSGECGFPL